MALANALLLIVCTILILGNCHISSNVEIVRREFILTSKVVKGKTQIAVNDKIPGPEIRVAVGTHIMVTLINEISDSTTIHWHGFTQTGTPSSDGVINFSQCALSNSTEKNRMLYSFYASDSGTYWYHGHLDEQYVDGFIGAIIVTDESDVKKKKSGVGYADEETFLMADWYDDPAHSLIPNFLSPPSGGEEPEPDRFVVNNKRSGALTVNVNRHLGPTLFRFINAAGLSMFNVSVDGMPLTVVELDGTAVHATNTPWIVLNVGQRAAFILDWSKIHRRLAPSPAIRFRVTGLGELYPEGTIGSAGKLLTTTWTGLISFEGPSSKPSVPTYVAVPTLPLSVPFPAETNMLNIRPLQPLVVDPTTGPVLTFYAEITFGRDKKDVDRGYINGLTYPGTNVKSRRNTLLDILSSAPNNPDAAYLEKIDHVNVVGTKLVETSDRTLTIPYGRTVEIFINNTDDGEHPMHLHGHSFEVIATSEWPEAASLFKGNYHRRDVVTVAALGWARIRFVANNPGVWGFHCHIEWHVAAGLVMTIIEAPSQLVKNARKYLSTIPSDQFGACNTTLEKVLRAQSKQEAVSAPSPTPRAKTPSEPEPEHVHSFTRTMSRSETEPVNVKTSHESMKLPPKTIKSSVVASTKFNAASQAQQRQPSTSSASSSQKMKMTL